MSTDEYKRVKVRCHDMHCLNNIRGYCNANYIVVGGKGRCKYFISAKQLMKHIEGRGE